MNGFAGVYGLALSKSEREICLKIALRFVNQSISVVHPMPGLSVAFAGDETLRGASKTDDMWSGLFGVAHGTGAAEGLAVDRPSEGAAFIAESYRAAGGVSFVKPPGMYIGIVADLCRERFFVYGDASGNREVFFSWDSKSFCFASHPLVCARLTGRVLIDRDNEDFLLIYGFSPGESTVYQGVRKLSAGHVVRVRDNQLSVSDQGKALSKKVPKERLVNADSLLPALYDRFLSCLETQLPTEDDVGVLLGGFDSALVAAALHRLGKRVHTYTFRYSDETYNQPHTDTLSRHLGIEHHWVDITPSVIRDGLQDYPGTVVQPTNWMNYVIQSVHLSRMMSEHGLRYAYSGDGCDALFLGYPGTYRRTKAFAALPQLPPLVVKLLLLIAARPSLERRTGHPYRMLLNLIRAMGRPMPARAFLTFRVLDELSLSQLRKSPGKPQSATIERRLAELASPFAKESIQRIGYLAKGLVSPNRAKLCASFDATGLRVLSPYLHPELKSFASNIPVDLLREVSEHARGDPGKKCLMSMAERFKLLPTEIIYQPKLAAVDSPIDAWLAGPLKATVLQQLSDLPFDVDEHYLQALVSKKGTEKFYKRHIGSTRVISDAVSLLVTYASFAAQADKVRTP